MQRGHAGKAERHSPVRVLHGHGMAARKQWRETQRITQVSTRPVGSPFVMLMQLAQSYGGQAECGL